MITEGTECTEQYSQCVEVIDFKVELVATVLRCNNTDGPFNHGYTLPKAIALLN